MADPLNAADLWPLVAKLPPEEKRRLALLALRAARSPAPDDAAGYDALPPAASEFCDADESLAWDADGWDELYAAR